MSMDEPGDAEAELRSQLLRRLCSAWLALQAENSANQALRLRVQAMEASQSWRVTAPLRWLKSRLRGAVPTSPALAEPARAADAGPLDDPTRLLLQRAGWAPPRPSSDESAHRLLVDVTELAREDLRAGIQRVVTRLLIELLIEPPPGFRVEPVRLSADGNYAHAREFLARMLGLAPGDAGADVPVAAAPGDVFFGLDLIRDLAPIATPALRAMRANGVAIVFVVYDLLPLSHPHWFPVGMHARFGQWLDMVVECADKVLCISVAVQRELAGVLAARGRADLALESFPLGADVDDWKPARSLLPALAPGGVRFLLVGTIEPRKGHRQTLAAFESLWAKGLDLQLVFAGHAGWCMDGFLDQLDAHAELGRRLHWLRDAGDGELGAVYRDSTVLLAPSCGEGFGLPLVEAADHGLPLLARDLPVFHEVAGAGADYFRGESPGELAAAVCAWLESWRRGACADPALVRRHTWRQSAGQVSRSLLALSSQRIYRVSGQA